LLLFIINGMYSYHDWKKFTQWMYIFMAFSPLQEQGQGFFISNPINT